MDMQAWLERPSMEYMTHALVCSLNYVGGVAPEINTITMNLLEAG